MINLVSLPQHQQETGCQGSERSPWTLGGPQISRCPRYPRGLAARQPIGSEPEEKEKWRVLRSCNYTTFEPIIKVFSLNDNANTMRYDFYKNKTLLGEKFLNGNIKILWIKLNIHSLYGFYATRLLYFVCFYTTSHATYYTPP